RAEQGGVDEYPRNNVRALFDGGDVGACNSTEVWSSPLPLNQGHVAITWDLDELRKKRLQVRGIRFQAAGSPSNFPMEVELKASATGVFDGGSSLGETRFLPPNGPGDWGNWLPIPDYDRDSRFLRLEITSQYEVGGTGLSGQPIQIAESELLVEADNDDDHYSDAVELAEGSDRDDASSTPLDHDGDFNPDATDGDDDDDGLGDAIDPAPLDVTEPDYPSFTGYGDNAGDKMGESISGAGDVNNDGVLDIVVGIMDHVNGVVSGTARVISGADGAILYNFHGDSAQDKLGTSVSGAGDVNGDGFADIIAGAPQDDNNGFNSGSAKVFSGFDGSQLWEFNGEAAGDHLGYSVSGAGDVDQDGYDDVVVGAYGHDGSANNAGRVYVFSGADGSVLLKFDGDDAGDFLGYAVSDAGDVDGDGIPDVMATAHKDDDGGDWSGSVRVYSGDKDKKEEESILYTFHGESSLGYYGTSIDSAGDVNNDGHADIVVGAWAEDHGGSATGSAWVYSGRDGATLHRFDGPNPGDYLGRSVDGAGDVNGDGYDDVIAGAYGHDAEGNSTGMARVYSGLDGRILYTFTGDHADEWFGYSVAGVGDVDQDGYADVAIGIRYDDDNGMNAGGARFISGGLNSIDADDNGVPDWLE
ncbi:MAG: FG-GAP-like repeat-containing protein, partial [Proteobacteria bacterium]|nr:FG-GAP-like repeat-containing protein [Pseudomonadota bacterium]